MSTGKNSLYQKSKFIQIFAKFIIRMWAILIYDIFCFNLPIKQLFSNFLMYFLAVALQSTSFIIYSHFIIHSFLICLLQLLATIGMMKYWHAHLNKALNALEKKATSKNCKGEYQSNLNGDKN